MAENLLPARQSPPQRAVRRRSLGSTPVGCKRSRAAEYRRLGRETVIVSCPRNTRYFVAIKMGRRQGGPSRTGARGSISKPIRDRRATQPPTHFHRIPLGRGQLAVFPRCSLDPYDSDLGASLAP